MSLRKNFELLQKVTEHEKTLRQETLREVQVTELDEKPEELIRLKIPLLVTRSPLLEVTPLQKTQETLQVRREFLALRVRLLEVLLDHVLRDAPELGLFLGLALRLSNLLEELLRRVLDSRVLVVEVVPDELLRQISIDLGSLKRRLQK